MIGIYNSFMSRLACLQKVFVFTLANSAKKITPADPSDFLSSNMAAQLSSWSIIIYFPNPSKPPIEQFKMEFDDRSGSIDSRRVTYQGWESKF